MITRFVKMTFKPDMTEDFLGIFDQVKGQILAFEGCESLELLRDKDNQAIFFTRSVWVNASSLEAYRQSSLFKEVWSRTKIHFAAPAEAWSLQEVI